MKTTMKEAMMMTTTIDQFRGFGKRSRRRKSPSWWHRVRQGLFLMGLVGLGLYAIGGIVEFCVGTSPFDGVRGFSLFFGGGSVSLASVLGMIHRSV